MRICAILIAALAGMAAFSQDSPPQGGISGVLYKYYEGGWESMPDFVTVPAVKSGTIKPAILNSKLTDHRERDDGFGFVCYADLHAPADGEYSFYALADDVARIYIDGQLLLESRHNAAETGAVTLAKGRHNIEVHHYEGTGSHRADFYWSGPGFSMQLIGETIDYETFGLRVIPRHNNKDDFSDPAAAREKAPDFIMQGEYEGSGMGAHVIARSGGYFDLALYEGGLPGKGFTGADKDIVRHEGGRRNGEVQFGGHWKIVDGVLKNDGKSLQKIERTSPTQGLKPPDGAIVMFDGSGLGKFKDAKLQDGTLGVRARSTQALTDHFLHIEFRVPYQPGRWDAGRGNSGVFLQERHELEILDTMGRERKNSHCGGIINGPAPKINMAFPPLSWQTYDVAFKAAKFEGNKRKSKARVSVWHNGVLIHDNVELRDHRDDQKPGGLYLQDQHRCDVRFRNIWVLPGDGHTIKSVQGK
jgi:hypothetical protein